MRVISSPSISTTGFLATTLLAVASKNKDFMKENPETYTALEYKWKLEILHGILFYFIGSLQQYSTIEWRSNKMKWGK